MNNKNIAVLGADRGDECKGAITKHFSSNFDWVIKYSGSSNAGHTIYHKGTKIIRHLVPCADFSTNNKAFIGSNTVINLDELLTEVQETEKCFPGSASKIFVDPDAFLVLPEHIKEDKEKFVGAIGSTGKGITPAYRDKVGRKGIKVRNLINDNAEVITALKKLGVQFKYAMELYDEFFKSKLLFEGSQSIILDLNFGTYPYITSSETSLNGIINSGLVQFLPSKVYGVIKAYTTKVGQGNLPTECDEKTADNIRNLGKEYGSTTSRPRRIGWLDLPAVKYSIQKGGITDLVVAKLDILNGFKTIPVCYQYEKELTCGADFADAKPKMMDVVGWENARNIEQIKPFINNIEKWTERKVSMISCGVNEDDIINLE